MTCVPPRGRPTAPYPYSLSTRHRTGREGGTHILRRRLTQRERLVLIAVLVAVLIALATLVETGFVLFMPGQAEDLSRMVTVPDGYRSEGTLLMTTILARPATPGLVVWGIIHPRITVCHLSQIVPPGMDLDEYQEHARVLMQESQVVAVMVALRQLGMAAELQGQGVEVSTVVPGGRWERLVADRPELDIRAGDVILVAGGEAVGSVVDLVAAVARARDQGLDSITVDYRRDDVCLKSSLLLDLLPDTALASGLLAGRAGVVLKTVSPLLRAPLDVTIDAGEIGGPSAGMMFALEIINQLTDIDLSGGRVVSGTGALSELGEALPVGGVRQKVLTAEAAGAEVFLVPRWQVAEARRAARTAQVVPVDGLTDALAFLETAVAGRVSPAVKPAPATSWLTLAVPAPYN